MSLKLDQAIAAHRHAAARARRAAAAGSRRRAARRRAAWLRLLREAWERGRARSCASRSPTAPPRRSCRRSRQYFLRENLRLRLLAARVALLSHDDAAFKTDVTAANAWVKQYFDTRPKSVQVADGHAHAARGDAHAGRGARRLGEPHRAAHREGHARAPPAGATRSPR